MFLVSARYCYLKNNLWTSLTGCKEIYYDLHIWPCHPLPKAVFMWSMNQKGIRGEYTCSGQRYFALSFMTDPWPRNFFSRSLRTLLTKGTLQVKCESEWTKGRKYWSNQEFFNNSAVTLTFNLETWFKAATHPLI